MKRIGSLVLAFFCLLCSVSCHLSPSSVQSSESEQDTHRKLLSQVESGDAVIVYVSGIPYVSEESTQYPSSYTIGTRVNHGELDCENGNIFAQAIKEYSEQTGIPVEIQYLEDYAQLQQLYEEERLPDLVVLGKHTSLDYVRLARQGVLKDLTAYAEKDDRLQNSELYYHSIINGGKIAGNQYVMPILFNYNGLITSESYLQEIGMTMAEDAGSYDDLLHLLEKSCAAMMDSESREAIFEASGRMNAGSYIPCILLSAAYPAYMNEQNTEWLMDPAVFSSIFKVMQQYHEQEFAFIPNWKEKGYFLSSNGNFKSQTMMGLEASTYQNVGIFLLGGRSGGADYYSSILTDAMYFHSVYEQDGEKMVLRGIPTTNDSNAYAANITLMAYSFEESKYADIAYDISRYLMDYSFPMGYGLSVNRSITEEQLRSVQSTTMTVYPDFAWSGMQTGSLTKEEIQRQVEEIRPLKPEYAEEIRYMLDHTAGAGLPNCIVEKQLLSSMINMIGEGEMTPEEAAEWMLTKMDEYLTVMERLEAFYDASYEESVRLGGAKV